MTKPTAATNSFLLVKKLAQMINLPTPCLVFTARSECVDMLFIWDKHRHFALTCLCQKQIYMILFGFFKCNFATVKTRGFLQAALPNKTYLLSLVLTVVSPSLTFHMVTEACDRLSFSFWVLSHFLSYTWFDLWRGFQGCSHHLLKKKDIA